MLSRKMFVVAGAVVLALAGGVVAYRMSARNAAISITKKQLDALEYQRKVAILIRALQAHRGVSMAFVRGDGSVDASDFGRDELRISDQLSFTNRFAQQHTDLPGAAEKWKALGSQIQNVIQTWRDQPRDCFQRHTEVIAAGMGFVTYVGDASTLLADPVADIRALADATTKVVPELAEALGQVNDLVTDVATEGMANAEEQATCKSQAAKMLDDLERLKADLETAYAANDRLRPALEAQFGAANQAIADVVGALQRNIIGVDFVTMPLSEWSGQAKGATDSTAALHDALMDALRRRLEAKLANAG